MNKIGLKKITKINMHAVHCRPTPPDAIFFLPSPLFLFFAKTFTVFGAHPLRNWRGFLIHSVNEGRGMDQIKSNQPTNQINEGNTGTNLGS